MVVLKFPSKVLLILEKERSSLCSGTPRATAAGRRNKQPELWLCGQEPLGTKLHDLDGDPRAFPFLPVSAVVSKENSEWRAWSSEGINDNLKWTKVGLSDCPPIRPTENNFFQPLAWLCVLPGYNLHVHREGSFQLLLCLDFRSLGLPLFFVKNKNYT